MKLHTFVPLNSLSMASFTRISLFITSLSISVIGTVQSRLISLDTSTDQLVSDGVHNYLSSAQTTCTHAYGFIPCADNLGGFIFQVILFQYLLFVGGYLVTDGSKKLFTMFGTGVFGASIFRVLVGLPRIIFVIVSGVFATKGRAKQLVTLGVSIYAGSTILCLTLLWGMCVIVGRTKLNNENSATEFTEDSSSTQCLLDRETCSSFKDTGVHTDDKTSHTAGIMLLSLIPYAILLILDIFKLSSSGSHMVVVIALGVSTFLLLAYFAYQIVNPWIQERSLEYCKYETLVSEFLQYAQKKTKGKLVDDNGQPNGLAIERFFGEVDTNADNKISIDELEKLVREMEAGNNQGDEKYAVAKMMNTLDPTGDGNISLSEFVQGTIKLINDAKKKGESSDSTAKRTIKETDWKEVDTKLFKVGHDGTMQQILLAVWTVSIPVSKIILGITLMTFLSRPFMEAIFQFSNSVGFSTFFISFIIIPIIINARRAISAVFPASQKSKKTASLTFSEIYGEVIMNNVMGLTGLLAIVWAKDLTWNFSAEVLVVFVICAIVGLLGFRLTTYPLWTCILAFFMYLLSIVLYYVLTFYLGW